MCFPMNFVTEHLFTEHLWATASDGDPRLAIGI